MAETQGPDDEQRRRYMKALLDDVHALERMLEEPDTFESGIRRIGAEQEMFLVDRSMHPAPVAVELLDQVDDERLVNELARFNLEANLSPQVFGGRCLSEMEAELTELVAVADKAAESLGARVLLTGILPTLRLSDLSMENMTPKSRYLELNRATTQARGGAFHVLIKGRDELEATHDNVMLESCNTSFQLHFQVAPREFAKLYNMAQAITAPVLAAAVNSPLLLGRQLWQETRVALFQHSVDSRSNVEKARNVRPRVGFGDAWVRESAVEVYRENISRFRVLFVVDLDEDPMGLLEQGRTPPLTALRLHNGTVYRWNRVCYGIDDADRPHLRIENRVLPAGPTIIDEMANAAFFHGLMSGCLEEYGAIDERMAFDDAKNNFFAAARHGLQAQFTWVDGRSVTAAALILDELIPLARAGLLRATVDSTDVDRYLGVLEERVRSGITGARWAVDSLKRMDSRAKPDVCHRTLTRCMLSRQSRNEPVHTWESASLETADDWRDSYRTVGQFMTTDVFTVRPDDLVNLAASLMDWEHLRHVPVEDEEGHVVGLLSHRALLRMVARGTRESDPVAVRELMKGDPVTVSSTTPTLDAIELMRNNKVGCLPVVDGGKLVGIVTEGDLIAVTAQLLEEHLRGA